MNPVKKPLVTTFTLMLFGIGLCSLGVMVALERAFGGAHFKERSDRRAA